MTYTFAELETSPATYDEIKGAELETSPATYDEIKGKLLAAGYEHAILPGGLVDMRGIALKRTEPAPKLSTEQAMLEVDRAPRLEAALQAVARMPVVPAPHSIWRHRTSNRLYRVVALAFEESDLSPRIIYRPLNAEAGRADIYWSRPLPEFIDRFEASALHSGGDPAPAH